MRQPIFLSIRDKATRLPGKSFVDVGGRPAVEQLILRLKRARHADGIVITTSVHPDDAVFEPVARAQGVGCFRGSEDDKLERYRAAAGELGAEFIVVVDGDDLLCDPEQIDRILATYEASAREGAPLDYVIVDGLPLGATGFGVRVAALGRVCELKAESDTEVWGGYFMQPGLFNVRLLEPDDPALRRPEMRFTLDYPEDLEVFQRIYTHYGDTPFGLREAIAFFDQNPDMAELNRQAHARYTGHLAKSAPVRLKDDAAPTDG